MTSWRSKQQITTGGTLLSVATLGEHVFVASPAGLFTSDGNNWRPVVEEMPFAGTHSVLHVGGDLLVAGLPHGLVRSTTGGTHWLRSTIEQTTLPITCLVASPNYEDDRVVLAGTAGDGVLRSTDGGKFWQAWTWGMDELGVVALACSPVWGRREMVVAATEDGLYQSPNGGRAWRRVQMPDSVEHVLALLFLDEQMVLGGLEEGGLIISHDAGQSWELFASPLSSAPINALSQNAEGLLLAGCSDGTVASSKDKGQSWQTVKVSEAPILTVGSQQNGQGNLLLAGTIEDGLYCSFDDGDSWQPDLNLAAHRFAWLQQTDEMHYAAGPDTGIWQSVDRGETWQAIPFEGSLNHMVASSDALWVATPDAVWKLSDDGTQKKLFEPNDEPVWIATANDVVWIGLRHGNLWVLDEQAQTMRTVEAPFTGLPLLGLAVSAAYPIDSTIITIVADERASNIVVWRSVDGGESWHEWHRERRVITTPRIVLAGYQAEATMISLGTDCLWMSDTGWQRKRLTQAAAPITALAISQDDSYLALTPLATHVMVDGQWHATPVDLTEPIVDFLVDDEQALGLGQTGRFYQLPL